MGYLELDLAYSFCTIQTKCFQITFAVPVLEIKHAIHRNDNLSTTQYLGEFFVKQVKELIGQLCSDFKTRCS